MTRKRYTLVSESQTLNIIIMEQETRVKQKF